MNQRPICSYEGSRYSTEFWTPARAYEDGAERIAMQTLLPPRGNRLIEIGAGFGRMAELYAGYDTVVLTDYARTQLEQAVARLGNDPRYVFVLADFYHQPFAPGIFDTVTMIRTLHHAADVPIVLRGIAEMLKPRGAFVLEFANKHNLKALIRYALKRQSWSPYTPEPVEFVPLNFDFHPRWVFEQLDAVGLRREAVRSVSHFRVETLKRLIPARWLVMLDAMIQPSGAWWQLSPSVFVRARAGQGKASAAPNAFFRCPACNTLLGAPPQPEFLCSCGQIWRRDGAIYDFRYPRE